MKKLFIVLLCLIVQLYAQIPPQHTQVLYQHPLTHADASGIGSMIVNEGSFTEEGWAVSSSTSMLRLEFDNPLPSEATLSVTMKYMLPIIDDDWVPISLYSRGEGEFSAVNNSPGSYVMLKTDPVLREVDPKYEFKFLSSYFYGADKTNSYRVETRIPLRTWDFYTEYTFSFIWTPQRMWCKINDQVIALHEFTGQVEEFLFMYLGKENTYNDAMYGVIYSDLQVSIPDASPTFQNIAQARGGLMADQQIGLQGAVIADFDGNDQLDVYTSHFRSKNHHIPNMLFLQEDSEFAEQENARQANDPSFTFQSLAADFDKDGDTDIFTMNFHKDGSYSNNPNYFYLNDGAGNFTQDNSISTDNRKADSKGCTLIDLGNDGDMDIIVANSDDAHQIYENNGSGHFNSRDLGLENFRITAERYRGLSAADLNGDAQQELIFVTDSHIQIAGYTGQQYEEKTRIQLIDGLKSCTVSDIDNDADPDLLVCMVGGAASRILVLENHGNFQFTPAPVENITFESYGVIDGDFDNDGDADLYAMQRNGLGFIYLNDGSGNFERAVQTGAECYPADGRGSAVADFNNDGKLDILVLAAGDELDHEGTILPYARQHLFLNTSDASNNYLQIKMTDAFGQESGIGTQIRLFADQQFIGYQQVLAVNGYKSSSSLTQHFGCAEYTQVDVEIDLPDGTTRFYPGIASNQKMCVHVFPFDMQTNADTIRFNQGEQVNLSVALDYMSEPVTAEPVVLTLVSATDTLAQYTRLSNAEGIVGFELTSPSAHTHAIISSGDQSKVIYFQEQAALAIELLTFTARFEPSDGVTLHWKTISETDNLGFHIFRKGKNKTTFQRINDKIIASTRNQNHQYTFVDKNIKADQEYVYQLADVDRNGMMTKHEPITVNTQQPYSFALQQNYPNPFNGQTHIYFELATASEIVLELYNVRGQKLATLASGLFNKGKHTIHFKSTLPNGRELSSGVYLYKLSSQEFTATRKLLLAK